MQNAILKRVKNQALNLKTLSEELQVQMALGKAEARDLIEEERKNLSKYIETQKSQFDESDTLSVANRRSFLTVVEDLESALNDSIPVGTKAYDDYKNGVLRKIYKVEETVRSNYPTMSFDMQDTLDSFKVKMDAFRVNLALHDKDNPEKVESVRRDFTERLQEVRGTLSKNEEDQSRLDSFAEDISESFKYLRRAIDDLSK